MQQGPSGGKEDLATLVDLNLDEETRTGALKFRLKSMMGGTKAYTRNPDLVGKGYCQEPRCPLGRRRSLSA